MKNKHLLFFPLFFISLKNFAIKPDRNYVQTPQTFHLSYTEEKVKTPDGLSLNTWICKPQKENDIKRVLILAYPDAGNMSYWLNQVAVLVANGFTVVMFDYRGFGQSDEYYLNSDFLYYNEFVLDLETLIKWTKINFAEYKLGIYGLAMGTIISIFTVQREPVDFLVLDGFIASPMKMKKTLKRIKGTDIILPDGYERYEKYVQNLKIKTLLFAGKEDMFTPVIDSEKLRNLSLENKLVVFRANHMQGFMALSQATYGDKYAAEIIEFTN